MATVHDKRSRLTGQQAYILSRHLEHMRETENLPMKCSGEEAAKKLGQVLGLSITAKNLRSAAHAVGLEMAQVAESPAARGPGTLVSNLWNRVKALEERVTGLERQAATNESWDNINKGGAQ